MHAVDLHAPNIDLLAILFVAQQLRGSIGWGPTLCVAVDWTMLTLNKFLIAKAKV
jgi:hypothetical protein